MFDFTNRKFLEQPLKRQHKKCAELLATFYHSKEIALWTTYLEWREWMALPLIQEASQKEISNLYHDHLEKGEICKKEHHLLPSIRKGDRPFGEEVWAIAIFLDHVRSAHNVGSIIRTTEALRLGKLFFSSQTPFITNKQVQDTAMGSTQWIECSQNIDLSSLPRPIIALETSENALSLFEFVFPSSFTLVVGNEEYGCSDETLKICDYLIEIPMRGHKNSLNVANAFALAAGEISRQKKYNREDYDQKK